MQSAREAEFWEEESPAESTVRVSALGSSKVLLAWESDAVGTPHVAEEVLRPRTMRSAFRYLNSDRHDVRCVLVRPDFDGGAGLKFMAELRKMKPLIPILFQVPRADRHLISLAYCQGIELSTLRDGNESLFRFVEVALNAGKNTSKQVERSIAELAEVHGLTPTEKRIATATVRGMTRAQLLAAFEISVNTLKSQTRSILKKTGHSSLNDLSRVILSDVVAEPLSA